MPLSIAIGPGNEHDSKKLIEGLEEKPRMYGVEANIPVNPW